MADSRLEPEPGRKRKEWRLFLFIILLLFPLLSIALVGGFGFSVWIYQLIMGPPGPPG
jgi:periplasmic nitrate reductase NapE